MEIVPKSKRKFEVIDIESDSDDDTELTGALLAEIRRLKKENKRLKQSSAATNRRQPKASGSGTRK